MPTIVAKVAVKADDRLITKKLSDKIKRALTMAGNDTIADILEAQVVPKALGTLESTLQPLDVSELDSYKVKIHSNTPYARRLYFHPEYNFHREPWAGGEGNPNARGLWFEPWENGERTQLIRDSFAYYMRDEK